MRPDVIKLVIFANSKPSLAPLSCPSCEASVTRDHFCGRKPNIKSMLSSQRLLSQCVLVFRLLSNPTVFAWELPTMSVCHWMFNGRQTLWAVHWKQLCLPHLPPKKASVSSSRVKRNSKVCWKDLQSGPREAAQSADNCLRYRSDIWNSK